MSSLELLLLLLEVLLSDEVEVELLDSDLSWSGVQLLEVRTSQILLQNYVSVALLSTL